jgi:hypothetical protein
MKKPFSALIALLAAISLLAACVPLDPLPEDIDVPLNIGPESPPYEPPELIIGTRTLKVGDYVVSTAEFDFHLNNVHRSLWDEVSAEEVEERASEFIQRQLSLFWYAESLGFELTEEELTSIDEDLAGAADFADSYDITVEQLLTDFFGPGMTEDEFRRIEKQRILSQKGEEALLEKFEWSEDELKEYYEANPPNSVRHILVRFIEYDTPEEAEARAEELLAEWEEGDADEDSFAEMADEHSHDNTDPATGGIAGGLYEGITAGTPFVEPFLNWTIDPERLPGDTGIVETVYGYHIMYFVVREPDWESDWKTDAEREMTSKAFDEELESMFEEHPISWAD